MSLSFLPILNGETTAKPAHGFSGGPVHYYIPVEVRKGHSASYARTPLIIEGRFNVEPIIEAGVLDFLFRIDDATVTNTKPRRGFHSSIGFGC